MAAAVVLLRSTTKRLLLGHSLGVGGVAQRCDGLLYSLLGGHEVGLRGLDVNVDVAYAALLLGDGKLLAAFVPCGLDLCVAHFEVFVGERCVVFMGVGHGGCAEAFVIEGFGVELVGHQSA